METIQLLVTAIRYEAADTSTIALQRTDGLPLVYKAGQFLTLLFVRQGRELRRSYSFSSTPDIDPVPAITVKRVANGEISRYLLDHLRPGDLLTSFLPAGRFTLDNAREDLFFIAAGSGLVPVFSLLKAAIAGTNSSCILLSQQHDTGATPFHDELTTLAAQYDQRFRWTQSLTVTDGRLNMERLERHLRQCGIARTAHCYVCGPPAFMRMVQFTLRVFGIPEQHIKREHFTVEHRPPPPPAFDPAPRKVTLHTPAGEFVFTVSWPDSILQAGLKNGIAMPYSCRAGRCSSCTARLLTGRLFIANNEVLTEKDRQQGLVLTCVGYAETDVDLAFE